MSNDPEIKVPAVNSVVIFQGCPEDSVPEPALIVNHYSDFIDIESSSGDININYETIPELIKHLGKIYKNYKSKE
jgi:hypothetical protein